MFTPEARHSGSGAARLGPDPGQRPSLGAPADYGKKIEYPNHEAGLENDSMVQPHPCTRRQSARKFLNQAEKRRYVTLAKRVS